MIPVYSVEQVRAWDQKLIQSGFPSHTLMELAGKEAAKYIHQQYPDTAVQIFCGSGNNGGDGYVIARWLKLWNHHVEVVVISLPKTPDARLNATLCTTKKVNLESATKNMPIIIDAMLGTGQNRAPKGEYRSACSFINHAHQHHCRIYALDIPTGINPRTGAAFDDHFLTVDGCFSFGKPKHIAYSNADFGTLIDIDIGFDLLSAPSTSTFLIESSDLREWWPQDSPSHAKWHRGHVAIIAKGGAAVLCAHAAFIAGAGLVSIICSTEEWNSLHGLRPEVMRADQLNAKRHDAVVVGPGIDALPEFVSIWENFPNPMVVDAGGITLLAKHKCTRSKYPRILTPHSAEAARLLERTRDDVEKNIFSTIQDLQQFGFSILKGPYTKIGSTPLWIAPKGSVRLATAGSGDILAGLIAAFLAKKIPLRQSTALACFFHADAGCKASITDSASDILQYIQAGIITFTKNT